MGNQENPGDPFFELNIMYRRVHRSGDIGLWLVVLEIHDVIGGSFNVR